MAKSIAIIGINSFSGSTFARHAIETGHSVIGFARSLNLNNQFLPHTLLANSSKNLEIRYANILHESHVIADLILQRECAFVVNFAAQSMVAESWFTPEDWYDTNVSGLAKLVNNLRRVKKFPIIKFLHFSTPEVYGSTRNLIKENWNFNPTTPYAISRAASDLHLRAMFDSFGFPVIFTRTANIYGSHQRLYRIIPKLITKVIKGEEFQLHGAGNSLRSFIHSADVASALSLILEKGDIGETYHISGQEFISILDLTKKILNLLEVDFKKYIRITSDRPGKDKAYLLDSSKIRDRLGWFDQVPLEQGLSEVISWVKTEWKTIKDQSLEYNHSR